MRWENQIITPFLQESPSVASGAVWGHVMQETDPASPGSPGDSPTGGFFSIPVTTSTSDPNEDFEFDPEAP